MSTVFSVHAQLNVKTVLFQTIQFSICTQLISILPIGATTQEQSGTGSHGNNGVLRNPQSSSITGDCLVLYPGHSLGESYPPLEVQSVYYAVPADWAT